MIISVITKLTVPMKEQGIIDLYDAVAEEMDVESFNYDCRKISVSQERFENVESFYSSQGVDSVTFAMWWCCYGPKAVDHLHGEEIEIENGFFSN